LIYCFTGSQLPLFFVGGSLAFIAREIGGATIEAWMPIAYSLSLAAIAPFCGYLQDLFGRRNITLAGGVVLCVGIIVVATARSIGAAVSGMAVAGAGAAIGELTALAGLVINLSQLLYCLHF
jgi:MFS family permease